MSDKESTGCYTSNESPSSVQRQTGLSKDTSDFYPCNYTANSIPLKHYNTTDEENNDDDDDDDDDDTDNNSADLYGNDAPKQYVHFLDQHHHHNQGVSGSFMQPETNNMDDQDGGGGSGGDADRQQHLLNKYLQGKGAVIDNPLLYKRQDGASSPPSDAESLASRRSRYKVERRFGRPNACDSDSSSDLDENVERELLRHILKQLSALNYKVMNLQNQMANVYSPMVQNEKRGAPLMCALNCIAKKLIDELDNEDEYKMSS